MKIFIDSANLKEICDLDSIGIVDGVTTNPSLISQTGTSSYMDVLVRICKAIKGPVSAEVIATDANAMIKEGLELSQIASNIVIKVPATIEGIKACKVLAQSNKLVNVTLCFSLSQALLAAKVGAAYISPFVGRMYDNGLDGMGLIKDICNAYNNYEIETKVLVSSIRDLSHVENSAIIGADVVTLPPKIAYLMTQNNLTEMGLTKFLQDWNKPIC